MGDWPEVAGSDRGHFHSGGTYRTGNFGAGSRRSKPCTRPSCSDFLIDYSYLFDFLFSSVFELRDPGMHSAGPVLGFI